MSLETIKENFKQRFEDLDEMISPHKILSISKINLNQLQYH